MLQLTACGLHDMYLPARHCIAEPADPMARTQELALPDGSRKSLLQDVDLAEDLSLSLGELSCFPWCQLPFGCSAPWKQS